MSRRLFGESARHKYRTVEDFHARLADPYKSLISSLVTSNEHRRPMQIFGYLGQNIGNGGSSIPFCIDEPRHKTVGIIDQLLYNDPIVSGFI
jgi:hypothetical protein